MKIISYYTPGNYEKVIKENLLPTLKEFELDYYIEQVSNLGDWWRNTAYKARFIYSCLEKFKEDVVFSDADSQILQYPHLFFAIPYKYDIAIHYLDWCRQWRNEIGGDKFELLSGTMMFRYNEKVISLLKEYMIESELHIGRLEQKVLQDILEYRKDINIFELPAEYCAVIKHNNKLPNYIKNPVIIHNQASRKFKNK